MRKAAKTIGGVSCGSRNNGGCAENSIENTIAGGGSLAACAAAEEKRRQHGVAAVMKISAENCYREAAAETGEAK